MIFYNLISNKIDELMMPYFQSWYDNLSVSNFDTNSNNKIKKLYCDSERHVLVVHSTYWGYFWNKPLHNSIKPLNYKMETNLSDFQLSIWEDTDNVTIKGDDYNIYRSIS